MKQSQQNMRFWIGILLLVTNQPIGWVAMLVCNAIALKQQSVIFTYIGLGIYAFTWLLLLLGAWMAGPQGVVYAKQLVRRLFSRKAPKQTPPPAE